MGEEKKEVQKSAPAAMIELAVSKGADLDKLEKLLALQEKWEANEARKAYNKAMADFKANAPQIDKDRTVSYGTTKYNHASLYNVVEKISSVLSKNGLSASWKTKQNGAILVTCKITHVMGHSEETTLSAGPDTSGSKNAIQAIGSTVTYLQRYTLLALTGLATFDDNDGQGAPAVECISDTQLHEMTDIIIDRDVDTGKFCTAFGIEEVRFLPKKRFNEAMLALKAKASGKTHKKC